MVDALSSARVGFGTPVALSSASPGTASSMLRITTSETDSAVAMALHGKVVGPWVDELVGAWKAIAPRLAGRKLQLDLRGVTFADDSGKQVLRQIYSQSHAEIHTRTAWTEYLAEEIRSSPNKDLA
jgi:hypothetical protein